MTLKFTILWKIAHIKVLEKISCIKLRAFMPSTLLSLQNGKYLYINSHLYTLLQLYIIQYLTWSFFVFFVFLFFIDIIITIKLCFKLTIILISVFLFFEFFKNLSTFSMPWKHQIYVSVTGNYHYYRSMGRIGRVLDQFCFTAFYGPRMNFTFHPFYVGNVSPSQFLRST